MGCMVVNGVQMLEFIDYTMDHCVDLNILETMWNF